MSTLRLWNTASRQKEVFEPRPGKPVTLYVCGPTVYGRAHIGNARSAVVFDLLFRVLRHLYGAGQVKFARNFTDIDDKIIARAVEENVPPSVIAARYEAAYREDMAALGCLEPTFTPRATEHIAGPHGMIAMIAALIDKGVAYAADGHVLFEVATFPGYGSFSRRPMDEMVAGARVEVAPYKRGAADFVLWKPSMPDQPGWESPWGRGRPGWHIECSAMIRTVLGEETIDIHGGGLDLVFPHHENECAQSACAHDGAPLARLWMHNGFLQMGETKMSKSLGNIVTPRELLDAGWQGEVIRLALLSAHYRQPLVWTDRLLEQSKSLWQTYSAGFYMALDINQQFGNVEHELLNLVLDDLNTGPFFSKLSRHARIAAFQLPAGSIESNTVVRSLNLVGINPEDNFFAIEDFSQILDDEIQNYRDARANKDWPTADSIRDRLMGQGIALEVGRDGSVTWRRA